MQFQNSFRISLLLLSCVFITGICLSQPVSNFKLTSTAFAEGKPIPVKYTCDDANVSPALSWTGAPEKTKSFAIIMDDPDAPMGTWVHWVLYNIPSNSNGLNKKMDLATIKATDGLNSWMEKGYNGPCPPGGTHRYVFKLYALDKDLSLSEGLDKEQLLEAMKGHVLAETTLTGLFRVE